MNTQFPGERVNPDHVLENPNQDPTNSDPMGDKVPLEPGSVHTPLFGGTLAPIAPSDSNMPVSAGPVMTEGHPQQIPNVEPAAQAAPAVMAKVYDAPLSKTVPYTAPVSEKLAADGSTPLKAESSVALLSREESEHFHSRWNEIQGKFVDEPRIAVQQADKLVSEVIEHFTQMFAKEHTSLESQWNQGSDVSTEDLRKALQHYRSFFNRLVV